MLLHVKGIQLSSPPLPGHMLRYLPGFAQVPHKTGTLQGLHVCSLLKLQAVL